MEEIVLLGSAGEPWPVPGCRCRHCVTGGAPRRPSALAVGRGLILEGTQPFPATLPWPPRTGPDVPGPVGTPRRIAVTRTAAGLDSEPSEPRVGLLPGERAQVGSIRVIALPAGAQVSQQNARPAPEASVLVVVTPELGLLWAPDTGPLPEDTLDALDGAHLDLVVLDCRDREGRCDPAVFGHHLARLRARGALQPDARVLAAGLRHEGADPRRLACALEPWGAQVLFDDCVLTGPHRVPVPSVVPAPLRTLVLGGASSGKSALAEELLADRPHVLYAATGPAPRPDDPEWTRRVAVHRERRPSWWVTQESCDVPAVLGEPGPPVLLDSVGTWLTAVMHRCGAWDDEPGWERRTREEMERMRIAWRGSQRRVVAVCEDVGSGVIPASSAGRRFRDLLGRLTTMLADESEHVLLCVAGRAVALDGPTTVLDGRTTGGIR